MSEVLGAILWYDESHHVNRAVAGWRMPVVPAECVDGEYQCRIWPRGWQSRLHSLLLATTKSTHVTTMDADRWLIVTDSPVPLGIPFTRAA